MSVTGRRVRVQLRNCGSPDSPGAPLRAPVAVSLRAHNEISSIIAFEGIKEVIFMSDKYHDSNETTAARLMFEMAGVSFR